MKMTIGSVSIWLDGHDEAGAMVAIVGARIFIHGSVPSLKKFSQEINEEIKRWEIAHQEDV